jgi:hypothetical protein
MTCGIIVQPYVHMDPSPMITKKPFLVHRSQLSSRQILLANACIILVMSFESIRRSVRVVLLWPSLTIGVLPGRAFDPRPIRRCIHKSVFTMYSIHDEAQISEPTTTTTA